MTVLRLGAGFFIACDFLMHVLVCSGVLDELKPDRSCVETDINELEAELLQFFSFL